MKWKMEKIQNRFEGGKKWIFVKVRVFVPPGHSCFRLQSKSCACLPEGSVHTKVALLEEGLLLVSVNNNPTANAIQRPVHVTSLASGARRRSDSGWAKRLCHIVYQRRFRKGLAAQLISLRAGSGWEMRKQSGREQKIIHLFISQ